MTPQLLVRLTQNKYAAGTFRTVVLPILDPLTGDLRKDLACEGIGFDISYHMHTRERSYDYEGKEILVVVLDRIDAWALSSATADSARQDIANRNKISAAPTSASPSRIAIPLTFKPSLAPSRPSPMTLPQRALRPW